MKKRFVTLLLILIMLTACNGGSVGPAGPPGPIGPVGPPGADGSAGSPGECTGTQCEVPEELITEIMVIRSALEALEFDVSQIGVSSVFTREVDVVIYGGSGPMNLDAIKDVRGFIKGDMFSCEFKVDNGGRIDEGTYMCVPVSAGQPSGYARFFDGTARISGGVGNHGRIVVDCISEWQRPPGVGNKWGVRGECSNFNPFTEDSLMGGIQRIGKRFPFTANTDDHWRVTITIP